jgi:hypothetical protein
LAGTNQRTVVLDPRDELPAPPHERLERRYGVDAREVLAIAAALRVAIAMAPERGWSSERTFREAEAWALAARTEGLAA